jgi:uncharacterized protein (TIGR02147 family)
MKPNIFTYEDYRKYLADMYAFLKRNKRGFSFRFFARQAGFSSPNFLKLIMSGARNPSSESLPKIAKGFGLNQAETEFFTSLVEFTHAGTAAGKKHSYEKMIRSRKFREIHPLARSQLKYFSQWYYPAVRELLLLPDFRESPQWIAQKLNPPITPSEAMKAIDVLLSLDLIERGSNGQLKQKARSVTSGAEVDSMTVRNLHHELLQIASEALDAIAPADRDVSALMLAIPKRKFPEFKEKLQNFRKELLAMAASTQENADSLYHVSFQFFPLTSGGKK